MGQKRTRPRRSAKRQGANVASNGAARRIKRAILSHRWPALRLAEVAGRNQENFARGRNAFNLPLKRRRRERDMAGRQRHAIGKKYDRAAIVVVCGVVVEPSVQLRADGERRE